MNDRALSWIEIDAAALRHNIATFRRLAAGRRLGAVVKANAYGHGLVEVARLAVDAGADWLDVFTLDEALALRAAGLTVPVLVFGPVPGEALTEAAARSVRVTVSSPEAVARVLAAKTSEPLHVHLKLETGTHRQGLQPGALADAARLAAAPHVVVEGAYTHFADIEDTTDHAFARQQLAAFAASLAELGRLGVRPGLRHTACTAAALLFEDTYFDLLRVGIGTYGLWPSKETLVSVKTSGREAVELRPVMTWKTRVAELKDAPVGATVGYGRTFKTMRPSRLAVLPVGYANGYDRGLGNRAYALVRGQRARVVGRVMMNMSMLDVTDLDSVRVGDEVVLLGRQGDEVLSAETLAGFVDTINYEIVTRAEPGGVRRVV